MYYWREEFVFVLQIIQGWCDFANYATYTATNEHRVPPVRSLLRNGKTRKLRRRCARSDGKRAFVVLCKAPRIPVFSTNLCICTMVSYTSLPCPSSPPMFPPAYNTSALCTLAAADIIISSLLSFARSQHILRSLHLRVSDSENEKKKHARRFNRARAASWLRNRSNRLVR